MNRMIPRSPGVGRRVLIARGLITAVIVVMLAPPVGAHATDAGGEGANLQLDDDKVLLTGDGGDMPQALADTPAADMNPDCAVPGLDDQCELWTVDGAANSRMVVSPTSERLFTWVDGQPEIVARDATDGQELWQVSVDGISSADAPVRGVAVSPDGSRVYAVADDIASDALHDINRDLVVVAFRASDGGQLWRQTLGLPAIDENDRYVSREQGAAIAVSPDGHRVYVAGDTRMYDRIGRGWITHDDVLVAGYEAATGADEWVTTWGDRFAVNRGIHLGVSPDSRTIYIGGTEAPCVEARACPSDLFALAVRAYSPEASADEGTVVWDTFYDGFGGPETPTSMGLAPGGGKLYMTGRSGGVAWTDDNDAAYDWVTVAYHAGTGAEVWVSRYRGPGDDRPDPLDRSRPHGTHVASSLAVSPDGEKVFVTGTFQAHAAADADQWSTGAEGGRLWTTHGATLAYDAATGNRLWTAHLRTLLTAAAPVLGGAHASPDTEGVDVDIGADGQRLYVLGQTNGLWPTAQVTVSYDSDSGAQQWIARVPIDEGAQLVADQAGTLVYTLSVNGAIQTYDTSS